jgi:acyl carrier protein
VRAGERVLVHSAGGALGHELVTLARRLGAEVAATAGSERKRASLIARGAAFAADSRAPRVAEDVLALAGGRGFDVALDLAGDGAPLAALAAGGRYIALDRTGAAVAHGARAPRKNLSLHSLDPIGLLASKPEELAAALRDSLALASSDELNSAIVTSFPIAQLGRALRFMAQARHVGKVVVSFAQRGAAMIAPLGVRERIAAGAVLAVGEVERHPALAQWLAAQGAREIVRAGAADDLEACAEKLSAPLRAVVFAPEAEKAPAALARARELASLASEHGAVFTWFVSDANAVLAPEANLEAAIIAAGFAEIARARRARGEPATAISLGLAVAATAGSHALLTRIAESEAAACVVHASAPTAWDSTSSPLLRELGAAGASTASKLSAAAPADRRARVRELVGAALALVLRLDAKGRERVDWHRPLSELGLDSLMGVELHTRIEEAAGVEIPPAVLFAEPNLEAVVERLCASFAGNAKESR